MRDLQPASGAYTPGQPMEDNGTFIQDEPVSPKYEAWGYTIGYLVDKEGGSYPEGCNTAIFRIAPGRMTEPVYVTKPDKGAVFEVDSVSGMGKAIVARANGLVEEIDFDTDRVEVMPGDAYSYVNTGDEDLVLYDLAIPAFQEGDDVDITSSVFPFPEELEKPQSGFKASVVRLNDGSVKSIELPNEFWDKLGKNNLSSSELRFEGVGGFFGYMSSLLPKVPELKPVMEWASKNPEYTTDIFRDYIELTEKLFGLSGEDLLSIQGSWERLMESRKDDVGSVSKKSAVDILSRLNDTQRAELAKETINSINPNSPYFEAAVKEFVVRTEGGHNLKLEGSTPRDGDPESDKVIWGHTQITGTEALLHFAISHYLERYFSQVLADQGVEFAATSKDYFLNAMTDVLMLDHFGENRFAEMFDIRIKSINEGGMGWIKEDRIRAYDPNIE